MQIKSSGIESQILPSSFAIYPGKGVPACYVFDAVTNQVLMEERFNIGISVGTSTVCLVQDKVNTTKAVTASSLLIAIFVLVAKNVSGKL